MDDPLTPGRHGLFTGGSELLGVEGFPRPHRTIAGSQIFGRLSACPGLGLVFLVVISFLQGFSTVQFLYSLIALIMCQAGTTGILLSFGVVGANFTWDDPRKMNSGGLGCLGQILTMLYLPISFGLFILPLGLANAFGFPIFYGYLFGLLIGIGITALCCLCSHCGRSAKKWKTRRSVRHIEPTIFKQSFLFLKRIGLDTCTGVQCQCAAAEALPLCQGVLNPPPTRPTNCVCNKLSGGCLLNCLI